MTIETLCEKLTNWIRERVAAAGARGVVVGMSGGVDSSVTVVLCKRAFPQDTLGVVLPCHSSPEDEAHAELAARKFGIPTRRLELDEIYDALTSAMPGEGLPAGAEKMAEANLKPRLRMAALYYFANRLHYLVAGASNRSELTMGYFTKHGDGGVDIMPLGNLMKRQVRELARHLGIPQVIIDKFPSAGLWLGQTDEEEMGLSYEELDAYLETGEASPEAKRRIEAMQAASAHKRALPPIPDF